MGDNKFYFPLYRDFFLFLLFSHCFIRLFSFGDGDLLSFIKIGYSGASASIVIIIITSSGKIALAINTP